MAVIKKTLSLHPLYVIFHVIEIFYIYNSFKIASFCEDVHFYVILRKEQMWVPWKLKTTTIKIPLWGNWITRKNVLAKIMTFLSLHVVGWQAWICFWNSRPFFKLDFKFSSFLADGNSQLLCLSCQCFPCLKLSGKQKNYYADRKTLPGKREQKIIVQMMTR